MTTEFLDLSRDVTLEIIMRILLTAISIAFLAGCATTPPMNSVRVDDHKYGTVRYASKAVESDFVGTSATTKSPTKGPSWLKYSNHP